jgi:hypothetical protein
VCVDVLEGGVGAQVLEKIGACVLVPLLLQSDAWPPCICLSACVCLQVALLAMKDFKTIQDDADHELQHMSHKASTHPPCVPS